MNILFLERSVNPILGGVERVTWLISQYLKASGHSCFYAYYLDGYDNVESSCMIKFSDKVQDIHTSTIQLCEFIKRNKIQIVINQGIFEKRRVDIIKGVIDKTGSILISCLHLSPDFLDYQKRNNSCFTRLKHFAKSILCAIGNKKYSRLLPIQQMYDKSRFFVLLSPSFENEFCRIFKLKEKAKIVHIPDPCSFSEQASIRDVDVKEKMVLIISRLEDIQKNITGALRIWKEIEDRGHNDWTLVLGGYGCDEEYILDYASDLELRKFSFVGKVDDVIYYYRKASIFLMTSRYEGFGMTLTEALQMGCIPIAFDTYTSLHDIITDSENGYIVDKNKYDEYINKLEFLMENKEIRMKMAKNAITSSKRFSIDVIGKQWCNLINIIENETFNNYTSI